MAVTHRKFDQDFSEARSGWRERHKPIQQVAKEKLPGHGCAARDSNPEPAD
jgi:hypothetical protein